MNSKNRIVFFFLSLITLGFCCKQDTLPPMDVDYDYFPSTPGHWALYIVDSTYYDGFHQKVYYSHFLMKDSIESTFIDNAGRPTQRIERYKKFDTLPGFLKDVWAANLTASTAENVEENVRFIKLVFPIAEEQLWNGNALNTLDEQDYRYINLYQPYTVNGVTYDSTITVVQQVDTNLVSVKNQFEVYAKHAGLIYKKFRDVKKFANPAADSVISGVDYSYRIIGYGK